MYSHFKKTIWDYYKKHKRSLPWRNIRDPYKILVSEIMLQQTQVSRVIPKYKSFLKKFPNTKILAQAKFSDVLKEWQGLGYNRRAKYLKLCAEKIEDEFDGKFPRKFEILTTLPGIGSATAGDILAFAYNVAVPIVETNIRTVYIHFFFKNRQKVSDTEILKLVEKTLDRKNPKEWYSALFDYGAFLKETKHLNTKSAHYTKQSRFEGSNRQKRSHILKLILKKPRTEKEIQKEFGYEKTIVSKNLLALQKEGMIVKTQNIYSVL